MSATRPVDPGTAGGNGVGAVARAIEPPAWLRDLGIGAWLLIGIGMLLAGIFYALAAATEIVGPLVAGGIVATVASPLVSRMSRGRRGRGLASLLVLLALVALAGVIFVLVFRGISGQAAELQQQAASGADKLKGWLEDAGLGAHTADKLDKGVKSVTPDAIKGLANGLVAGVQSITSLALGLSFTLFSVFFLLKDGPKLRATLARHLGVPEPVGRVVVGRLITSIRGYFLGVTIVAAFNGVVVGIGAWLLGVPLAATLGVVTFALAYIPFIGAFVAGALAVIVALGAEGTTTALWMLLVVLLANGLLQNIVSPFAMGAALDMNPLLNLAVTVGAGCLFGMFGLILAAPLTSAALHVAGDLRRVHVEPGDGVPAPGS